ncbi:MAG: ABC transporter transmembrane domain-containing protein [Thermodesulfobacteriota bacterium]
MRESELIRRLLGLVRPHRSRLGVAMACMVVVSGLSSAAAYMFKPLIDEVLINRDQAMLTLVPLGLVALYLVKGFFYYSYFYLLNSVGLRIVLELRAAIYGQLQALSLSFFQRTATGELISRTIADVTLVQGAVADGLVAICKYAVTIVALLGVIFYHNWRLALLALIFFPSAGLLIARFGRRHRRLSRGSQETLALVSTLLHETITGSRIVKAFAMERYEMGRFMALLHRLLGLGLSEVQARGLATPLMEILGGISVAFCFWFGGRAVLAGESTPGTLISFLVALAMIYEPIRGISSVNSTLQQGLAAARRVFALLDLQPEVAEEGQARDLPPISRELAFRDVSFAYGEETVLAGIELTVPAGQMLAIVGPSGAGKSTLVDLVPRFFDVTAGAILVDGVDIRSVTLASLRRQIGIVTQQTILFNDTVRSNIAYGDTSRSETEIEAAARAAHAWEFIERLPRGLATEVGEAGVRLSGGERQRLAIARALLKNPPILVLDEATSALDAESEREVQKALDNLMQNRTTLVIAHRLSTIRNAHRIVVLDRGRIVETGSHEELLAADGLYRQLHDLQFADGR